MYFCFLNLFFLWTEMSFPTVVLIFYLDFFSEIAFENFSMFELDLLKKEKQTKFNWANLKILLVLLNSSWIGQYPIWQTERRSEKLYKMEDFNRQKRGLDKEILSKEYIVYAKVAFLWGTAVVFSGRFPH